MVARTELFPLAVDAEHAPQLAVVAEHIGGGGIHQHIDFAIGPGLFERIGHRRGQKHIAVMLQLDNQNPFGCRSIEHKICRRFRRPFIKKRL